MIREFTRAFNECLDNVAREGAQNERKRRKQMAEIEKQIDNILNSMQVAGPLPSLVDRLHGLFARLEKPVDFDAIDEQPVDLICLLLAPETAGADHLKALARVSRLLRDPSICEKLRGTDKPDAIYALLTESATSHAA